MTLKQNFTPNTHHLMDREDKNEKYRIMMLALEKKCSEIKNSNEVLAGR